MTNYFTKKEIADYRIRRIDAPERNLNGDVISRPVIAVFRADGSLYCLSSMASFKYYRRHKLAFMDDLIIPGFYCELRQML